MPMRPTKTPELMKLLTPALNAARDAAETMESALDLGDADSREVAFAARDKYESLRDNVLKKLDMASMRSMFLSADAAVESGDIDAVNLLRDKWGIEPHPTVESLREVDRTVRDLEAELEEMRAKRAELTASALNAGFTQYHLAQSIGRNESSIHSWRNAYFRRNK